MYLLIDTSERDKINLALFDDKIVEHKSYSGMNRELLSCIHDLFEVHKVHKVCKVIKFIKFI